MLVRGQLQQYRNMGLERILAAMQFWPFSRNNRNPPPEESDVDPKTLEGFIFELSKRRLVDVGAFQIYVMPDDYIGQS